MLTVMSVGRTWTPPGSALAVVTFATLVLVALRVSSLTDKLEPLHEGRWVALGLLATLGAAAAARSRRGRAFALPHALAASLVVAALLSAVWSVNPELTVRRAIAFALLVIAAVSLDLALPLDGRERVLDALAAAAGAIALAGFVLLAFDWDRAVQPSTDAGIAYFRGFGGNPNTVATLAAVTLPLCAAAAWRRARARWALVAGALLVATIVASGSRGAAGAGALGLVAFAALAPLRRGPRLAVAAAVTTLVAGAVLQELRDPAPAVAAAATGGAVASPGKLDAELATDARSARFAALAGAVEQGLERPAAGFGYGTEEAAFVDRYEGFQGSVPENSYAGVFLQLGLAGLALLLALAWSLLRVRPPFDATTAACTAVVAAGLATALTQSYLLAAGGIATLPVWLAAFLNPGRADGRVAWSRRTLAVAAAVALVLVGAARWETARYLGEQRAGLARIRALVGPLDNPTLSAFRVEVGFDCLLYRRDGNPYALELCFELSHSGDEGRLLEAIDRRAGEPRFYSLRTDPEESDISTDARAFESFLERVGAVDYAVRRRGAWPVLYAGGGSEPIPVRRPE